MNHLLSGKFRLWGCLKRKTAFPFLFHLYLAVTLMLGGCAIARERGGVTNSQQVWQQGPFKVLFQAGPFECGDSLAGIPMRSFSAYQVSRSFPGYTVPYVAAIESAQSLGYFQAYPKARPSDFIRLFLSDSGRTLLIEERIPNDCAPCTNDIVVTAQDGQMNPLEHVYLELPEVPSHPKKAAGIGAGMVGTGTARVVRVTDKTVTLRFPDGSVETKRIKALVKPDHRPTFPG
jgi:hypothetical protein